MEINKENITHLLKETDIKPSKNKGQNFLINPLISSKIVGLLSLNEKDNVLEIGPGLGSLTHFINIYKKFDTVEIDSNICDLLDYFYKKKDINIINKDVFKCDISNYNKIISNMPYNITTKLVEFLMLNAIKCERFVLMGQEETIKRFLTKNGKDYGVINVLISLVGEVKDSFVVSPNNFVPAPKCKSKVFVIEKNLKYDFSSINGIYKLAKQLFLNRRKTLFNNLSNITNKEIATDVLIKLNIDNKTRIEQLTPKAIADIFFSLKNR